MKHFVKGITFLFILFLIPLQSHAFPHGYERKTDEIYATVRNDITVYSYPSWDDYKSEIPHFTGIKVISRDFEWYEIEYETKENTSETGWISKDEFYSSCLIYDGRDKQRVANGNYEITYCGIFSPSFYNNYDYMVNMGDTSLDLTFIYVGDNLYHIKQKNSDLYFQSDPFLSTENTYFWGDESSAGLFYVVRKGDYFSIQDSTTNRFFGKNMSGILCFNHISNPCWKFRRFDKAIDDDSIRVFAQFDADWAGHYYGPGENPDPDSNVFTTSACGIFSTMNAIYSLTGMYADPYALADYAVEKEYRILDAGTDNGFFKAAADEFGDKYGFSYDGSGGSVDQLIEKLAKGDVAITHVPGHYTCIVDYNEKTKKFLLLDPHYLPKRGTCAYGDWVTRDILEGIGQEGNLEASEYYFYSGERPYEVH